MMNRHIATRGAVMLLLSLFAAIVLQRVAIPQLAARVLTAVCCAFVAALLPIICKAFSNERRDLTILAIVSGCLAGVYLLGKIGDTYHDQLWLSLLYIACIPAFYAMAVSGTSPKSADVDHDAAASSDEPFEDPSLAGGISRQHKMTGDEPFGGVPRGIL